MKRTLASVFVCVTLSAHAAEPTRASLEAARKALAEGDAPRALTLYEALTTQGESLDAELGLVRAALQAGEFRKAMSWATLTAGEHPESAEAAALLAYLQDRVGRTEHAIAMLKTLHETHPDAKPAPPRPVFQPFPVRDRPALASGNGLIVDGGTHVLTYSGLLPKNATAIYVRNGLGSLRRAEITRRPFTGALVKLRLSEPYPPSVAYPHDQFIAPEGTRFCFAFAYGPPDGAKSGYPAVAPGIVFRPDAGIGNLMQVTSATMDGNAGAPVFDPRGHLMGISVGNGAIVIDGANARTKLGRGSFAVRVTPPPQKQSASPPKPSGKQPPMPQIEELYERLLPSLVQLVAY